MTNEEVKKWYDKILFQYISEGEIRVTKDIVDDIRNTVHNNIDEFVKEVKI